MYRFGTRLAAIVVIGCGLFLAACSEPADPGQSVSIPTVNIACGSSACRSGGSFTFYVVITSSSCQDEQFGAVATGSGTTLCTAGSGCTGNVLSWGNSSGTTITEIPAGTYTLCGVVDFDGNYATLGGTADSGDATGIGNSVAINAGADAKTISDWADVP